MVNKYKTETVFYAYFCKTLFMFFDVRTRRKIIIVLGIIVSLILLAMRYTIL